MKTSPGPLHGRRVCVTRAADRAHELATLLVDHGATVVELPVLRYVERAVAPEVVAQVRDALDRGGVLAFTSPSSVAWAARVLGGARAAAYAVAAATARAAQEAGFEVAGVPDDPSATSLAALIAAQESKITPVVWLHNADARPVLRDALTRAGRRVIDAATYASEPHEAVAAGAEKLFARPVDAIVFTSSHTVEAFDRASASHPIRLATPVVSIGSQTTQTLRERGYRCILQADSPSTEALVASVIDTLDGVPCREGTSP